MGRGRVPRKGLTGMKRPRRGGVDIIRNSHASTPCCQGVLYIPGTMCQLLASAEETKQEQEQVQEVEI